MSETNKVILEVDVPKDHEINGVELFARDAHGNVKTRMLYNDPTMLPNNFRIIERAQVVLDGWKLAPVEPVQGMAGAGWSVIDSLHELESMRLPPQLPQKIYRAMLLAAPSPVAAGAVWDDASVAAIKYALQNGLDGLDFLRYWNEGEFDIVRREWPDAPESVFIGADPLYAASNDATDFEHYLQQMIDDAPEPLRRLGQWLGKVLDEDHWPTAERMLLGACKAAAAQQTHTSAGVPEQGVLEIKTDREMLVYLMNAFDNERHVCNVCGHEESTKDIDSAHFLREHLASYPAPTPAGVPDEELARLREIEHRAWHLLDAATTEGEGDYEKLTIDGYLSREELDVLNELLPEDHPPIDETGRALLALLANLPTSEAGAEQNHLPSDDELMAYATEAQFFLLASEDEVLDIMRETLTVFWPKPCPAIREAAMKAEIIIAAIRTALGQHSKCFDLTPDEVLDDSPEWGQFSTLIKFTPKPFDTDDGRVVGQPQLLTFSIIDGEPLLIVGEDHELEITATYLFAALYFGGLQVEQPQ